MTAMIESVSEIVDDSICQTRHLPLAYLQLNIKFHADYPDLSPHISVAESENVDDVEAFENQIKKIVRTNIADDRRKALLVDF